MGEPLFITDMFVDRTCLCTGIGAFLILTFTGFCVGFKTYWPSPVTVRDLIDYTDIRTKMFDLREAAQGELQTLTNKGGLAPLQRSKNPNWDLAIGIECITPGCDNAVTPRGLLLMDKINDLIEKDKMWPKFCLRHSRTNSSCADDPNPDGGVTSKATLTTAFKVVFKNIPIEEYTQYAIDLVLYGLT